MGRAYLGGRSKSGATAAAEGHTIWRGSGTANGGGGGSTRRWTSARTAYCRRSARSWVFGSWSRRGSGGRRSGRCGGGRRRRKGARGSCTSSRTDDSGWSSKCACSGGSWRGGSSSAGPGTTWLCRATTNGYAKSYRGSGCGGRGWRYGGGARSGYLWRRSSSRGGTGPRVTQAPTATTVLKFPRSRSFPGTCAIFYRHKTHMYCRPVTGYFKRFRGAPSSCSKEGPHRRWGWVRTLGVD